MELLLTNVWFVLRHAHYGAGRIMLHILATILLTPRDPYRLQPDAGHRSPHMCELAAMPAEALVAGS